MVYDLVMAAIVLFTTWRGAAKGVAWQLAGIAALVLCFLFATPVSLAIAPLIKIDPPLNRWIAMLATYLIFSFVCFAAARTVRSALEAAKFEEFDRHLGAAFGFVKGATLCFVITFFSVCLSGTAADAILPTYSGKISQVVMRNIQNVLPAELERTLAPHIDKFDTTQFAGDEPARRGGTGAPGGGQGGARPTAGYRPENASRSGTGYRPSEDFRGSRGTDRPIPEDRPAAPQGGRRRPPITDDFDDQSAAPVRRPAENDNPLNNVLRDVTNSVERQVREGIKDAVKEKVDEFLGQPADRGANAGGGGGGNGGVMPASTRGTSALRAERKQLLKNITGVFYSAPDDMAAAEVDINQTLTGLPDAIAVAALRDWSADLLGDADPDPQTDVSASLEERVRRQLRRSGINETELPADVRKRLGAQ
jgi:membrane protein required for colicin V production